MNAVRVPAGADAGLIWHGPSPLREQRRMAGGSGVLWLSNREVLQFDVPRPEFDGLVGLRLSQDGRWAHADPGWGEALVPRLRAQLGLGVWWRRDLTVVWRGAREPEPGDAVASNPSPVPDGIEWIVPADTAVLEPDEPVGIWAYEALRIQAGVPRVGLDIPLDAAGLAPGAGGLRLTRLLLDTGDEALPPVGTPITADGRSVGRLGSSAQHYVWGPIGLGLLSDACPPLQPPLQHPLQLGPGITATVWS